MPSSTDFGTPIQVVWKLDGYSNASDWIGLFDYNGALVSQQSIDSQGLKSGTPHFFQTSYMHKLNCTKHLIINTTTTALPIWEWKI